MAENTTLWTDSAGSFQLRHAVLVYDRRGGGSSGNHVPALVTVHPVDEREGRPVIGAGVEATESFLRRLNAALYPQRARAEGTLHFLDPRVLGHCSRGLLWHLPCHRRTMKFKTKEAVRSLSGRDFWHPHIVFVARGTLLSIFAVLDPEARPTPDTELFFAPYYNLSNEGLLCWGSARHPRTNSPDSIAEWESAFFDSPFTHLGYRFAFVNHRGGHRGLWAEMAKPDTKKFRAESLVSTGRTLREILAGHPPSFPR